MGRAARKLDGRPVQSNCGSNRPPVISPRRLLNVLLQQPSRQIRAKLAGSRLALVLAILSSRSTQQPESVLRNQFGPGGQVPEAPTSVLESETDAGDGSGDQEDGGGG